MKEGRKEGEGGKGEEVRGFGGVAAFHLKVKGREGRKEGRKEEDN